MNFPEATEYLLNGEYIRRLKWYKDYYIKLENDAIFGSDGTDFSAQCSLWKILSLMIGSYISLN